METLAESWSSAKLGLLFPVATEKSRVSISLYVEDSNSIIITSTVSLNMHWQHIKYLDICFTGFLDDINIIYLDIYLGDISLKCRTLMSTLQTLANHRKPQGFISSKAINLQPASRSWEFFGKSLGESWMANIMVTLHVTRWSAKFGICFSTPLTNCSFVWNMSILSLLICSSRFAPANLNWLGF